MVARDPGEPRRPAQKELLLLGGLLLCLIVAVVTVVLPELGTGEGEAKKKLSAQPAGAGAKGP